MFVYKRTVFGYRKRKIALHKLPIHLPDSNTVTATNHVPKSCLISRSAYDFVRYHLVPLIPWTACYYKIFVNRGYLKCNT